MKSHKHEFPCYRRNPSVKRECRNFLSARGRALLERLEQNRKNLQMMIGFESDIEASMFWEPMSVQEKIDRWMLRIPQGAEREGVCSAHGQHRQRSHSSPDVEEDSLGNAILNGYRSLNLPLRDSKDETRDHSDSNIPGAEVCISVTSLCIPYSESIHNLVLEHYLLIAASKKT